MAGKMVKKGIKKCIGITDLYKNLLPLFEDIGVYLKRRRKETAERLKDGRKY